jgi:hypothetical protein
MEREGTIGLVSLATVTNVRAQNLQSRNARCRASDEDAAHPGSGWSSQGITLSLGQCLAHRSTLA